MVMRAAYAGEKLFKNRRRNAEQALYGRVGIMKPNEEQEANKGASDILWKYTPENGYLLVGPNFLGGPPAWGLGRPHRQAHAGSGCCLCVAFAKTLANGMAEQLNMREGAAWIPVSSSNPAARYRAPLTPAKVSSRNLSAAGGDTGAVPGVWLGSKRYIAQKLEKRRRCGRVKLPMDRFGTRQSAPTLVDASPQ
jgi:hypothetical protein